MKYSDIIEKEKPLTDYVDDFGNYVTMWETIKPGDTVILHFAGCPHDMPHPWIMVSCDNVFSTVNYRYNPSITVKTANGVIRKYNNANIYSPSLLR